MKCSTIQYSGTKRANHSPPLNWRAVDVRSAVCWQALVLGGCCAMDKLIQWSTIKCNTIQYSAIQRSTMTYN